MRIQKDETLAEDVQVYDVAWDVLEGSKRKNIRRGPTIAFCPMRGEQPEFIRSEVGYVAQQWPRFRAWRKGGCPSNDFTVKEIRKKGQKSDKCH